MTNLNTIIDNLSLEQARSILKTITADNKSLSKQVTEIALAQHTSESWEDVAYGLVDELEHLDVQDIWDRAGPTRDGYIETDEVADEMINDVLSSYLAEMKKYQALEMSQDASELCKGLIAGFYRFTRESTSEFKDWTGDLPKIFAEMVVSAWKEQLPNDNAWHDLQQFNETELNGWLTYSFNSKV